MEEQKEGEKEQRKRELVVQNFLKRLEKVSADLSDEIKKASLF